jgi:hypothetical protein
VLLELILGKEDSSGRSVYLRKQGDTPVRVGALNRFSPYIAPSLRDWYDLRLFPDHDAGGLSLDKVQRVRMVSLKSDAPPESPPDTEAAAPYTLVRSGAGWAFEGEGDALPETSKVEALIRGILDATGEDFSAALEAGDSAFSDGEAAAQVILETTTGATVTVTLAGGYPGRKLALVSGQTQVFELAEWVVKRVWQGKEEIN